MLAIMLVLSPTVMIGAVLPPSIIVASGPPVAVIVIIILVPVLRFSLYIPGATLIVPLLAALIADWIVGYCVDGTAKAPNALPAAKQNAPHKTALTFIDFFKEFLPQSYKVDHMNRQ
jgi:hypothetical protein